MDLSVFGILWALVERTCIVLVLFALLFHINYFRKMSTSKITVVNQAILAVILSVVAIYGRYSGASTSGVIANIRNFGPMMSGLLAGTWLGLGAGLMKEFIAIS